MYISLSLSYAPSLQLFPCDLQIQALISTTDWQPEKLYHFTLHELNLKQKSEEFSYADIILQNFVLNCVMDPHSGNSYGQ